MEKPSLPKNLLVDNQQLFETKPSQIHDCYGAWQDRFKNKQAKGIQFHEGIPEYQDLVQLFPKVVESWCWMI